MNTAGSATRGRVDCVAVDGGIVSFRITNGATGPTAQCFARILIAHKDSAMPAAGAEATGDLDWKQILEIGGGASANASSRGSYVFGPEVAYLEIEFSGNTGQDVTVEAHATTYVY
ncbi:MAG: hypothetical protein HYZ20_19630 [Burkholderiales bacterium]|nr:hypothetical protein [Burkholderiales bacterium]